MVVSRFPSWLFPCGSCRWGSSSRAEAHGHSRRNVVLLRRERAAESLDSSGSSGLGVRLLLRTPGPWALVTWEIRLFTWAACAVRSPSRDDRESRENHAGGFLSGSKPLLRRGGHWKSPGLRVESPTLQNLIGTSKNAPRS